MRQITEEVLENIANNQINWDHLSRDYELNENFIRKYKDKINWYYISYTQDLSEEFIREFQDKLHWELLSGNQCLSEEFIIEFEDKIDFFWLLRCGKARKYNENIQSLILTNTINAIREVDMFMDKNYLKQELYMTDFMIKQYEKLSIFL